MNRPYQIRDADLWTRLPKIAIITYIQKYGKDRIGGNNDLLHLRKLASRPP